MNKEDSRQQILKAAATLFAQQGYSGTSFAAVAKQANQSKTLVQYHFQNKDRLWKETVQFIWQQRNLVLPIYMEDTFHTEHNTAQQRQTVRRLAKSLIQFTIDNPEWVKILSLEAGDPGPRLEWMIDSFIKDDVDQGQTIISYVQTIGLMPKTEPLNLLCVIAGSLMHYVNIATITSKVLGLDMLSDEYIEGYVEDFISIMERASGLPLRPF